ncbi:unnamed protein product [Cladocopium goreaui]|uniref:DNA/RNA-binding protein KIN17 (Binding to curved DNA) (KIN, antigenic determinant of recA protein) n=1 Tax=Cladocopium goreaui TaxID=2562237 RepID=A0A9P1BRI8_9DINO|nr:unnamed protein product [Cladocopium goreaui]
MNGYFKSESGKVKAERGSTRWVYNNFLRKQTKLRWVCGLCNVWCKDENGFKCHLEHENHIRKSEIARKSKAPDFKMSPRDEAFAASFVQYLAQNYLNRKVLLHEVYREMYPDDRFQRLMQDTCWGSLGTFINALSKAGECEAVKGPKGWVASCFLAQNDATVPAVPEARSKRMQASWAATLTPPAPKRRKDDGGARRAAALAREAKAERSVEEAPEATLGSNDRGKVTFQLGARPKDKDLPKLASMASMPLSSDSHCSTVSTFFWPPGLVVKVLCTEALAGKAAGLKAETLESLDCSMVQVRLLKAVDGKENLLISVRPELLETVLPKLGSPVLVLEGSDDESMEGILDSVQTESYSCTVQIGSCKVSGLPYERVCKMAA